LDCTLREWSSALSLVLLAVVLASIPGRAQQPAKLVLILHPFDEGLPSGRIAADAAKSFLNANSPEPIEFYSSYLDLSRFPSAEYRERLAQYLAAKHAGQNFDVVLALGPDSLGFAMRFGDRIAPGAPVVFCCASTGTAESLDPPPEIAGVTSEYDLLETLSLARTLQPEARNLYVVTGAAPFDRDWGERARRELAPYESQLDITYFAGLPFADLLRRLGEIDRNSIVIQLSIFADGAGRQFIPADTVADVTGASAAPVYAPYDTFLGKGIVGGYMDTFEASGTAMGELALKIMRGDDPGSFESRLVVPKTNRVDARQLDRFGLDLDLLPPDSTVLFKEPSLWERHRNILLGIAAAFALQTAVVGILLAQMRRRRRAEASLKESEERMAFAASSVNIGMWHVDLPEGPFWATAHTRMMFGLPDGEPLTPASLLARVYPEDRDIAAKALRSPSTGVKDAEFRVALSDGSTRWIAARSHVRESAGANATRLSGSFADVTPRKAAEAEAELQRAELAHVTRVSVLGQLSGAIAHELNQPLTAILANAEAAQDYLRRPNPDLDEVGQALDDIVNEDRRAGDVIRRLLGLLRKKEAKSEPVDLNEIVASTMKLLNGDIIARRISVVDDLADGLPPVLGDLVQLQQVLINLLVNAMDAVEIMPPARRRIAIRTAVLRSDSVEVSVEDSGAGLSPEHANQALDPFFTTKPNGLGLGLPICSTIIGRHGGVLTLAPGELGGARAAFTLPAQELAAAAE
jgi:signal transduction histidine kinase